MLRVRMGYKDRIHIGNNDGLETFEVASITMHPQYLTNFQYDIAVLELKTAVSSVDEGRS